MFKSTPSTILLPDLVSYCKFNLNTDRNHKLVSTESTQWILNGDPDLDDAARRTFRGLKAGRFAALCYPHTGYPQLRVCGDFLNWFFHLDNLSDDMDDRGIDNIANVVMNTIHHPYTYRSPTRLNLMTKEFVSYLCYCFQLLIMHPDFSFWKRIMQTAAPGACRRLQETLEMFFQAIQRQALDRANGTIPDLQSYIPLRRDTSGCRTTWALIEYAYNLDIPDDVMDHPVIRSLGETTNDFVAWSNVTQLPPMSLANAMLTRWCRTSFRTTRNNGKGKHII